MVLGLALADTTFVIILQRKVFLHCQKKLILQVFKLANRNAIFHVIQNRGRIIQDAIIELGIFLSRPFPSNQQNFLATLFIKFNHYILTLLLKCSR